MTDAKTALFLAAKAGHEEDIRELLKLQLDLNSRDELGNTALHYAAGAGHVLVVQHLTKSGKVNVNAQNNVGDTPLHKVAFKNPKRVVDVINLLISAGANIQLANKEGLVPYDVCRDAEARSLLVATGDVPGYDPDLAEDEESNDDDDDDDENSNDDDE
eukprot:TRINITY_DN9295_c0_g1_i1.p1 TRINITY_DN9295_c0_g1~~TRINITY_DN9295_c0_g1_i1.p1  ORF type:complete len:159 (-),score=38.22 TRINITY_DN9295_c0_g1_i1:31-507(-)